MPLRIAYGSLPRSAVVRWTLAPDRCGRYWDALPVCQRYPTGARLPFDRCPRAAPRIELQFWLAVRTTRSGWLIWFCLSHSAPHLPHPRATAVMPTDTVLLRATCLPYTCPYLRLVTPFGSAVYTPRRYPLPTFILSYGYYD